MPRILKIYASEKPLALESSQGKIIQKYPAFTVAEIADGALAQIRRDYPLLEDITDQYKVPSGTGDIDTSIPRITELGTTVPHPAYKSAPRLNPGPHHYIVQFIGPIKQEWLKKARKAGADFVQPYEGFSYIADMSAKSIKAVSKLPFVRWMGHLPYSARLSQEAVAGAERKPGETDPRVPRTRFRDGVYTVEFFKPAQAAKAGAAVRKLGFEILEKRRGSDQLIVRSTRRAASLPKQLQDLSRVHGVKQVTERSIPRKSNDRAAGIMGTASSMATAGLGLSGDGEIIAVADSGLDSGDPSDMHPDFVGRIATIKSYPITSDYNKDIQNPGADDGPADLDSGHGTHTTGSVLGDGTASSNLPGLAGRIRGLSYRARLVFQAIEQEMKWKNPEFNVRPGRFVLSGIPNDLTDLFGDAYAKGARIHSNSWGGGAAGEYSAQCQQLDAFVWKRPDFCVLFAAGNDGRDGNRDGVVDLGSVTAPGTAKNCITVGASENNRPEFSLTYGNWSSDYPVPPLRDDQMADDPNEVAAFSSRGPTLDGRVKPDVVAPGTFVLSTRSRRIAENNFAWGRFEPSNLYMYDTGTSMATPLTAGSVGIVREYLRKKRAIASPSAALLKGTLIASAQFLGGPASGFDSNQGYGRVNVDAILAPQAPLRADFIDGAGLQTGQMDQRTITVTAAGSLLRIVLCYSDYPGRSLVNNLNLVVTDPHGNVVVGNSAQPGGTSFDATNNVELVHIQQAAAGNYRIQVVASNVPVGPQPFALVILGALTA